MTTAAATAIAHALADPTRLRILERLTDGPAAVSELIALTGEAQPKVSNHLAVLRERGLVGVTRIGRQRVYEVTDPSVGQLVESLGLIAGSGERLKMSPPLARARTCYDHLAGRLGVAIFDALVARRAIRHPDARYRGPIDLGPAGPATFEHLGIALDEVRLERRRFATACGDWSERRAHLGGALGAALWARALERGWVVRRPGGRVVVVTERGRRAFHQHLGVTPDGGRPRAVAHA
ncbi:MAG TPA: metalloregulator ArsR/SmtB family transcription factor [bacterium]|nr:metalloregulator ArsR/SmtB family transcription factor [bacterium]